MHGTNRITVRFFSQEEQLRAGCFNLSRVIDVAEKALVAFESGRIAFPDKIIQQFREQPQDRINCMPSTLLDEKICGVKWVSVFNENPGKYGKQSICAVMLMSEIETGFPMYFMDATLCSTLRVAAVGALGAKYFAREDSEVIGFLGAGEQAKTHLLGIKAVRPGLKECRVCGYTEAEETAFIEELQPLAPDMHFVATRRDLALAMGEADILVTATPLTKPLVTASMVKKGTYISQIGPYEVEPDVVRQSDKLICDSWESIKHRGSQPLTLLYKGGEIIDSDIHADICEVAAGKKPGRETPEERVYFKHVGLSYLDLAIGLHFARETEKKGLGTELALQEHMLFKHENIGRYITI